MATGAVALQVSKGNHILRSTAPRYCGNVDWQYAVHGIAYVIGDEVRYVVICCDRFDFRRGAEPCTESSRDAIGERGGKRQCHKLGIALSQLSAQTHNIVAAPQIATMAAAHKSDSSRANRPVSQSVQPRNQ